MRLPGVFNLDRLNAKTLTNRIDPWIEWDSAAVIYDNDLQMLARVVEVGESLQALRERFRPPVSGYNH
jgi:hypothetical protein